MKRNSVGAFDDLDAQSVIEEYDTADTRTARYVYAPGIDQPIYMERGVNRTFYHFDGSGSVVALTGTSGIVSERYTYGPYGESTGTSAANNPYRYTGRELDAETGLYYYRARYYSSALGRFLQPDPIGYADNLNLYEYVNNDPLNLTDPSGLLARETATRAYSFLNNLGSGLISQPSLLPPPGTSAPLAARTPDFTTVQVDLYVASGSATYTRYGDVFAGKGVSRPYPNPLSGGVSVSDGWLIQSATPSRNELNNFLDGGSTGAGRYAVVGGSVSKNASGTAVNVGLGVGGFAANPLIVNSYKGNVFGEARK